VNGEQIQHQQTGAVRTAISNGLVALLKKTTA
jgi:hypothetical protein